MLSVNVRISACGCWCPTHFPRTTPARRLSNKKKYCTYRPCCVLFTNKPAYVKSYKRHLVISRKILVLEHIEDVKYFHVYRSVEIRLAKCAGLLVKNTNKGERAGLKRTRRMRQRPFPRRGSNGDERCFRDVRVLAITTDYDALLRVLHQAQARRDALT